MKKKILSLSIIILLFFALVKVVKINKSSTLPLIAIANYGPHSSLETSIIGMKEELERQGFIEHHTISYEISNVGFDANLIPQMIHMLKNHSPSVLVVMTTPVAQYAKGALKDTKLVYNVITDPVEAGLIKDPLQAELHMTGSSDRQDLKSMLLFAKTLLPQAKRVGLLYATSESNDASLVKMMEKAAHELNMEVVAIGIDQARDIPMRMQHFKYKADFIYVGTSGPIQPTLPVIAAEAKKMNLPIINADEASVKENMVLASYGVNYKQVGMNTGMLVAKILKGAALSELTPLYPSQQDHHGLISKKKAAELGITFPQSMMNVEIIE